MNVRGDRREQEAERRKKMRDLQIARGVMSRIMKWECVYHDTRVVAVSGSA